MVELGTQMSQGLVDGGSVIQVTLEVREARGECERVLPAEMGGHLDGRTEEQWGILNFLGFLIKILSRDSGSPAAWVNQEALFTPFPL